MTNIYCEKRLAKCALTISGVYLLRKYNKLLKMGRAKRLNASEIHTILKLKEEQYSISQISKVVNRSRKAVMNLLNNPDNYGKKKSCGCPQNLTAREKRAILRAASNSKMSVTQIGENVGVNINVKNVRHVLQNCKHLIRKKMQKKPCLTELYKLHRLQFAEKYIHMKKKWRRVIFTDEKRFNLDGHDGFTYYYHDLRKEEQFLSRRHMGGGSVMIWACIGYCGKTEIKFITGRMNSKIYLEMIDQQINTYATKIAGDKYIFQQDNAAVHTAKVIKQYFSTKRIRLLDWRAKSPDLNIIENCWGNLAKAMYQNGRQFQNVNDLKQYIQDEWEQLKQKNIKKNYINRCRKE